MLYGEKQSGIGADTVLLAFLVIILVALVVFVSFTSMCYVDGNSMNDTLVDGQYVLLNKSSKAESGDIVVFYKNNQNYIKRVIAVGGETIRFAGSASSVVTQKQTDSGEWVTMEDEADWIAGGEMKQISQTKYPVLANGYSQPVTIAEGYYFVMGDNRNHSEDSRRGIVDMVSQNEVTGKVIYQLTPGSMDEWLLKLLFSGGMKGS